MKCPICGSEIEGKSKVCGVCGSDLAHRARRTGAHAASRLPYDPHVEIDKDSIQRSTVAELKETKAAYKEARRNAGKSNAPKIIGVLLAMVLAAGAGAAGTWYFMSKNTESAVTGMQAALDEATAETQAAIKENASLKQQLAEAQDTIADYEKALADAAVENAKARETESSKTDSEAKASESSELQDETSDPVQITDNGRSAEA